MRVRTVLALLLLTLYPATAHAWWWDYFDGLSGPGPFATNWPSGWEARVWSCSDGTTKMQLLGASPELTCFAVVRIVGMNNDRAIFLGDDEFAKANDGKAVRVQLLTLDVAVMRRLSKAPAFDVGVGVSIIRASGDTI